MHLGSRFQRLELVVVRACTQVDWPVAGDVNRCEGRAMSARETEAVEQLLVRWRQLVPVAQIQESPENMAAEVVFLVYEAA